MSNLTNRQSLINAAVLAGLGTKSTMSRKSEATLQSMLGLLQVVESLPVDIAALNPNWSAADVALIASLVSAATETKANKGCVRLLANGKTIAWVNPNRIDFPGTTPAVKFSTARKAA